MVDLYGVDKYTEQCVGMSYYRGGVVYVLLLAGVQICWQCVGILGVV